MKCCPYSWWGYGKGLRHSGAFAGITVVPELMVQVTSNITVGIASGVTEFEPLQGCEILVIVICFMVLMRRLATATVF